MVPVVLSWQRRHKRSPRRLTKTYRRRTVEKRAIGRPLEARASRFMIRQTTSSLSSEKNKLVANMKQPLLRVDYQKSRKEGNATGASSPSVWSQTPPIWHTAILYCACSSTSQRSGREDGELQRPLCENVDI